MCPVYLGKLLDQKENWVTQIWLLLNEFCLPKKTPHWPRVLPCPRGWCCSPCAPPPTRPPDCLLPQTLCSSLHYTGCGSDEFGLMPLALRVQKFSLVAGYICAFLHTHCKRFLICFQYSHLKVVSKGFILCFSSMCVFQMLIESRFLPDFLRFFKL